MNRKHVTIGVLAHVDAGKTTLAESLLYLTGTIRKLGRVDHGDAFLDHNALERARGITIFSKQAELQLKQTDITLLDTPGHVDFSAEMERTLQVLDYALLIINGAEGIQGHVKTLWKLLQHYNIPTFLFVNKMDQPGADKEYILKELQKCADGKCVDFSPDEDNLDFYESLAMCSEELLQTYLCEGNIPLDCIQTAIENRQVFPCFFGSALKMEGLEELIEGLDRYTRMPVYDSDFNARIYKISRDKQGTRLTHLKVTGGSLKVKQLWNDEKIDQIRVYHGETFSAVNEAHAGQICAVTGLYNTKVENSEFVLKPILTYQIELPETGDVHGMFLKLKQLEEEIPELHLTWNEKVQEIHAQVMGPIQIEILEKLIPERFGTRVHFGNGNIVYQETISEAVEGAGHYEPLRHYAEVRLLMEPAESGSGVLFESRISEDILDKNWQRLILTHLSERAHKGVLTGSEITDMKITLINGRAHLKHTEGGDFRQATYRAVRQGLKKAKSILLEPIYEYQLEVPTDMVGRAMSDIQKMYGTFETPETIDNVSVLKGTAPVVCMRDYQTEVHAYTKGQGRLFCTLKGYAPCHNAEEVIENIGYDSEKDLEHPTSSVFCDHGAGFVVPWDKVEQYMHTESDAAIKNRVTHNVHTTSDVIDEDELQAIFKRTFGSNKREKEYSPKIVYGQYCEPSKAKKVKKLPEVLLVDGYNIIFAWEKLKELAEANMDAARGKLMDILSNYQGCRGNIVILVFDGYKVPGNLGEVLKYHNIYVVYTKEAETADQYIEKTVHDMSSKYHVQVATSDAMEQMIILGQGAHRMSARELLEEILIANQSIQEEYLANTKKAKQYLFENLPEDLADFMDDVRMGRRKFDETEDLKGE